MYLRILMLVFLTGALLACDDQPARKNHEARNIILILVDTLRADHLSFYGYQGTSTPFLNEVAASGAVFERSFSTSSWTAPATASVMTGLYPTQHGITEGLQAHRRRVQMMEKQGELKVPINSLPTDVPLLSEILRESGYVTYGAATNPNIGPAIGFDRGFDQFEYALGRTAAKELFERISNWKNEIVTSSQPVFLYLHLNDVHDPYERRAPWYTAKEGFADHIAAYDSQIPYVDLYLGQFLSELDWRNSVVIFISDHGDEFREHGSLYHNRGLHQELNRIPFMIHAPDLTPQRVSQNVSLIDVLPTVLELVKIPPPGTRAGWSLVPLLSGNDSSADARFSDRVLFAHREAFNEIQREVWWSALHGQWKLIEDSHGRSLYNHSDDFLEENNLISSEQARAEILGNALKAFQQAVIAPGERSTFTLDSEMLEELRALGYVE